MATAMQVAPNNPASTSVKGGADHPSLESTAQSHIHCPDPSAHQPKGTLLQDQASAAALQSSRPAKGNSGKNGNIMGPDGKLSSASAATSLKYARAQDLPSFPVVGINTQSSAGAAATLANANKKSPELWKPEQSSAAGKAALLAKDYKMAPLWQPEASSAGSKAALLAHRGKTNTNIWTPEATPEGHSAATLAMRRQSTAPTVDQGAIDQKSERSSKALRAATGAVSSSGRERERAKSTPAPLPLYPDSANSAKNALNAAKLAHTPSMKVNQSPSRARPISSDTTQLGSGAMEAARIQHAKSISRDMYTERPPLNMDEEEKQRSAALRASAISMAKKMYDVQQSRPDTSERRSSYAHTGAVAAHGPPSQSTDEDIKEQALRYIGIQEAAQKLAAERLAKIGPDENAAFRSYYGYDKPTRAKLTMRRNRNRGATEPEDSDSDEDDFRSRRIRSQMSQLNKSLAEVDAQKRTDDRKYLLAAAERKVQAQLQGMDKKIFDETGKMSPAMIEEWDAKARAKAAAASEARMENHGRVHIGHGQFMDQADIDAVAQARIQPTLDEIAEKTEKRRAEEEERRLDVEAKKREQQKEKARAAELKADEKRIKDEEKKALKSRQAEEKAAAKYEKEAEKERKAEEKRKRKSGVDVPVSTTAAAATAATPATATEEAALNAELNEPVATEAHENENDDLYRDATPAVQRTEQESTSATSPTSPTSPKSDSKGIKSFLSKLKRRSKHSTGTEEPQKSSFIGGANLRKVDSPTHSHHNSVPTSPQQPTMTHAAQHSYSDVSSVSTGPDDTDFRGRMPQRTESGISALSGGSDYEEARDEFDERLAPPPSFPSNDATAGRKGSPNRDSRFHEIGI